MKAGDYGPKLGAEDFARFDGFATVAEHVDGRGGSAVVGAECDEDGGGLGGVVSVGSV